MINIAAILILIVPRAYYSWLNVADQISFNKFALPFSQELLFPFEL